MQQITPNKDVLKNINRYTKEFVIFLIAALLSFFVSEWTGATDKINVNCENEKKELRKELATERQRNDILIQQLIDKDEKAKQLDSLIRSKLEDKTKENLQNAKE